jgi:hypothetical protein
MILNCEYAAESDGAGEEAGQPAAQMEVGTAPTKPTAKFAANGEDDDEGWGAAVD